MDSIRAIALGKAAGGQSITVEALSVTENGTYTAPGSKAYSPVTVNVSGGGDNILPDAYKEVEYIQTSGTQYVEIYYRVQVDDEITVTTMLTEQTTAERGFAGYCENHSPANYYWELCYNEANLGYSSFPPGYNVPFRMVNISGNGKNISPNTKNTLVCKFATVSLLEKFYVGLYKTNAYNFTGRIYRFTIKRNGYKTLNLVPCYRVSDNVVGLFDLVRQAFYENAGSGSFGKGPDVA